MLAFLKDLISNFILIVPMASWFVASILKFIIASFSSKHIRLDRLHGDGGMPSCHTALVTSLVLISTWCLTAKSPVAAVSLVLALITINDALGVRRETGKQAVSINELADAFNAMFTEPDEQVRTEKLKVLVGHTPLQVVFGALVGVIVSLIFILAFGLTYGGMLA